MPPKPRLFALVLLVAALLTACDVKLGYHDKDRTAALNRVQEFRKLFEAQDYGALYEMGAPAMKAAVTKEQFIAAAGASAGQFGKLKSSALVASSCFPNEVRLVYHSEFEKNKATEWMVWAVPTDTALLVMYKVSPGHDKFNKESQVGCAS